MAYTQARKSKTKGTRYVGYYLDANGKPKVAGTFANDDEALRVAQGQEDHVRERRSGTPPAAKATITIEEFARERFLPRIEITPKAKQTYKSHLKNHIYPYLGRERIAEVSREQIYTHLVTTLPEAGATLVTRRAARTVLSSMLQMAWDEQYRSDNPVITIKLKKVPSKPVLVSTHAQWNRLEGALPFRAAVAYARPNVTTWARQCEMRTFRPSDFEFGSTAMINITRSASYVTSENHPERHAGWIVESNAKNGDWRRFAISQQMAVMIREHVEENQIGDDDLLFPQWLFAFRRPSTGVTVLEGKEMPPPLVSGTGKVYEHGTMGARFVMNCHCVHCKAYRLGMRGNAGPGPARAARSNASVPIRGGGTGPNSFPTTCGAGSGATRATQPVFRRTSLPTTPGTPASPGP